MRRMPGTRFCCAQGLCGAAAAGAAVGWLHLHEHCFYPRQRFERLFAFGLDLARHLRVAAGQVHHHAHRSVFVGNLFYQPKGNDVPAVAGVFDGS